MITKNLKITTQDNKVDKSNNRYLKELLEAVKMVVIDHNLHL